MHFGRTLGVPDWEEKARLSFERALEVDPSYAEPVHHLAVILRQLGDTAALRRLATAQVRRVEDGPIADYFRWQARHVWGDASPFAPPVLDSLDTDATLRWIGIVTQDYGFGIPDGRRAVRIRPERPGIPDERLERRLGALAWALNDGRPHAAALALESLSDVQPDPHFRHRLTVLTHLYADGDESLARSAASQLADASSEGAAGDLNTCVLGQWDLERSTESAALRRERRSPGSRLPPDRGGWAAHREICWAVVEAQRAHSEEGAGAASPSKALQRLDTLLAIGRHRGLVDSGHTEYAHLALARLFEAHDDIPSALRALKRRSYYNGWQPYLASILWEEGRLAASVGDVEGAIRSFEHYLAFRTDPEPVLRDQVADVERQLAALRRRTRSR